MADNNMGVADLRERAKEMLKNGILPLKPQERLWGGYGNGCTCMLCSDPIGPHEVEYELEVRDPHSRRIHLHLACYEVWEYERVTATQPQREVKDEPLGPTLRRAGA